MVIEEPAVKPVPEESPEGSVEVTNGNKPDVKLPEKPFLGRSARIVGDWESVDASETPHEKNKRGELGKPLFNWYFNRVGTEPIARISYPQSAADRRNTLQGVVTRAGRGAVNPQKNIRHRSPGFVPAYQASGRIFRSGCCAHRQGSSVYALQR